MVSVYVLVEIQYAWGDILTQRRVPAMRLRVILSMLDFLRISRLQILETGGLDIDDTLARSQAIAARDWGFSVGAWNVGRGRHLVNCSIKEEDSSDSSRFDYVIVGTRREVTLQWKELPCLAMVQFSS